MDDALIGDLIEKNHDNMIGVNTAGDFKAVVAIGCVSPTERAVIFMCLNESVV